ncbi:hypothetical protein ACF0H5_018990 [Mactra antiquata]
MKIYVLCAVICVIIHSAFSATTTTRHGDVTTQAPTTKQSTVQPVTTTPKPAPATTLTPKQAYIKSSSKLAECMNATSCETCVKVGSVQCLWCASSKKCLIKEHVIPTSECGLSDAKWAVCWLNYEALIIACSVIGGILIIGLTVCICCCCCCKKNNAAKYAKEDAKYERKKAEMKASQSERRAERKAKTDEIRRKYGLVKEDNPYTRFEDE